MYMYMHGYVFSMLWNLYLRPHILYSFNQDQNRFKTSWSTYTSIQNLFQKLKSNLVKFADFTPLCIYTCINSN